MMLTFDELKEMCRPMEETKAYYRPLLCRDLQKPISIFIVGINPATPITSNEMTLDEYTKLITNYDAFIEYYRELRRQRGKTTLSATRNGINGLIRRIEAYTDAGIAETNVISYPSQKPNELLTEPETLIERAKEVFVEVLLRCKPKLLIAHGQQTLEILDEMVEENPDLKWTNRSIDHATLQFSYKNGEICTVLPCSHLRYHGHKGGKRFTEFYELLPTLLTTMNPREVQS